MKYRIYRKYRRRKNCSTPDSFFQKEGEHLNSNPDAAPFFEVSPQVQPKLSVSQPNEPAEVQADNVADHVVQQINSSQVHRKCAACEQDESTISRSIFRMGNEEEEAVQAKLHRQEEEEENLQAKSNGQIKSAPNTVANQLQQSKGNGSQMDAPVKKNMESAFGFNFQNVRIHTGEHAQSMSNQINAQAFTYGSDIYFNKNKYNPESKSGQHLLAHELTHVVQQQKNLQRLPNDQIARACISESDKSWSEKVAEMNKLTGKDFNTCFVDMLKSALGSAATVHESTNSAADLDAAIKAGNYTARGTNLAINFDANFNSKTGNADQFGETRTVPGANKSTVIYIIMGPNSIKAFGPEFSQMTNQHEQDHAIDFTAQAASGTPHSATAGEELRIYTRGFTSFFLNLFRIDTSACTYEFADDFSRVFTNYTGGSKTEKDTTFASIESFFNNSISGNSTNEMKFKIWFQTILNGLGASHALVKRINGIPGIGLKKGTKPGDHLVCPTP